MLQLHYHFRNVYLVSIIIATAILFAFLPLAFRYPLENDGIINSSRLINPKDLANHTAKIIHSNVFYTIPKIMPKTTIITGLEIPRSSLGSATIDVYKDVYLNLSQVTVKNQSMCPNFAAATSNNLYYCNIDSDSLKSFTFDGANHWHDINRTLFRDALHKIGPILIVGDSLSRQMGQALRCVLETEPLPNYSLLHIGVYSLLTLPISKRLQDYIDWRRGAGSGTDWADVAIAKNVSCKCVSRNVSNVRLSKRLP